MKEAAGEANMTVITIVLIAIVLGVGTLIVTKLMNNTSTNIESQAEGCPKGTSWNGTECVTTGTTSTSS